MALSEQFLTDDLHPIDMVEHLAETHDWDFDRIGDDHEKPTRDSQPEKEFFRNQIAKGGGGITDIDQRIDPSIWRGKNGDQIRLLISILQK